MSSYGRFFYLLDIILRELKENSSLAIKKKRPPYADAYDFTVIYMLLWTISWGIIFDYLASCYN